MPNLQTPAAKAILAVVLIAFACLGICGIVTSRANDRIAAAVQREKDALAREKAAVEEKSQWQAMAVKQQAASDQWKAQADLLGKKVEQLARAVAAIPRPAPPTRIESLPVDTQAIAQAFNDMKLPAIPEEDPVQGVLFTPPVAREVLGLVKDGRAYPAAVERDGLLEEEVQSLNDQLGARTKEADTARQSAQDALRAVAAGDRALQACDDGRKALQDQNSALKTKVRAGQLRKVGWGLLGFIAGALLL
jgi:hypothetical protein